MEAIIKNENCYFDNIERVRLGLKLKKCDSDNDVSTDNVLITTPSPSVSGHSSQKETAPLEKIDEYNEL